MSNLNDKQITDIANFHHVGRDTNGMRLFTDYSLLAFARAILASRPQPEATAPATYVGQLCLGEVDGDELTGWEPDFDNSAVDALQLEMVRSVEEVWVDLYAVPNGNKFTAPAQDLSAAIDKDAKIAAQRARIMELEEQLARALGTPVNDWCPECHARESSGNALSAGDSLTPDQIDDLVFGYAPSCPIGEGRALIAAILQSQKDGHG